MTKQVMQEADVEMADVFVGADAPENEDLSSLDFGNDLEPDNAGDSPAEDAPASPPPAEEPPAEEAPAEEAPAAEQPAEEQPPVEAPPVDQRIPKERFDTINERRKAAEAELARLQAAQAAAQQGQEGTFDFEGKEREYMELVVDGEFDKANLVRSEIRAAESQTYQQIAQSTAETTREQTKQSIQFDETVAELQETYDVFNPESDGYDETLVDEALVIYQGFADKGYTPAVAITKAAKYVAKMNDLVANGEVPADPAPAAAPAVGAKPANPAATAQKVQAAGQQPPAMPGTGNSQEAAVDVDSMTEDEFDALPESKKAQYRGDFV